MSNNDKMDAIMKLSIGSRCVKYLMFAFNLLFVITGIILLTIGLVIHGVYYDYKHFLDNNFFSAPFLLVACGAIILFIAFFGCCGAVRENYCMIITFSRLLVLVFMLEIAAGISGYILRARASAVIQGKMIDTMNKYHESAEIAYVWDKLQRDFNCCGTVNATDWQEIPISCCETKDGTDRSQSCTLYSPNLHKQGCYPNFLIYIKSHAVQLAGFTIVIAFVQLTGIWFATYLGRSIKNSYESV